MPGTLRAASVADVGTQAAQVVHEVRPAAHEGGGLPANRRAIAVQANTRGHPLHVRFAQAGIRAVLALLGTTDARLNTRMVLLVRHGTPLSIRGFRVAFALIARPLHLQTARRLLERPHPSVL